ncbi:MAG: carbamoyltransferase, partial [Candidatus Taylorbacteria bacterium]|nr:carbamoyltransferase [Candidatus Taylorbacteria bacterium]
SRVLFRSIEVKKKLSEKIKQREDYRPVAPVTIEEKVHEYFIGPATSPFMLYKYDVIQSAQEKIRGGVHYDGSARVQTVNRKTNPFLYDLIKRFGDMTGIYVLLNTSLNLKGDPIANTIKDTLEIYNKIEGPKIMVYNGNIQ